MLSARQDAGALFENFFFMERFKYNDYQRNFRDLYFWRLKQSGNTKTSEVDFLEVLDEKPVQAFECKLSDKIGTTRSISQFCKRFPDCKVEVATPKNIRSFFDQRE